MTYSLIRALGVALIVTAGALAACGNTGHAEQVAEPVQSYLEGTITVRPEVDTTANYRGFEVVVVNTEGGTQDADTLGYAVTDSTGFFRMEIEAPSRNVYPILISRYGTLLAADNMAVAEADSATMRVQIPTGDRPFAIRSQENGALMAYRNTRAQYNQQLVQLVQSQNMDEAGMRSAAMQASTILWNLQDTYGGTIGGDLAAVEAVTLLDGWDDALLLERLVAIDPSNPRYIEAMRAGRQATARLAGQDSAIAFVEAAQARVDDPQTQAALQAIIVTARTDSSQEGLAIEAAQELQAMDVEPWNEWAEQALYELENLQRGMLAPTFAASTREGDLFDLGSQRGNVVVLEFYAPGNQIFRSEFGARAGLAQAYADEPVTFVSISLQPDTTLNEVLFEEGLDFPGIHIFAPEGPDAEVAQKYAIRGVPTRVVIDPDGRLVARYLGASLESVAADIRGLLGG